MFVSRQVGDRSIPCVVFYIIVVLAIFAYGYLLRVTRTPDHLEKKVIDDPAVANCDGWAGTHLLFWAFLGFWFPGHHLQALTFSLLWEGFEDFLGRVPLEVSGRRLQLVGATDGETQEVIAAGDGDAERFWYGRYVTDTFYNMAGYTIGSALGTRFWPPEKN